MKTYTGIVQSQEITTNRDSEKQVRMLKVEITEPKDIQLVEWVGGNDAAPVKGDKVVILEISDSYKFAVSNENQIEPTAGEGERIIYSNDGAQILASIYLKADGNVEVNGNGDFAVRFNEMKSSFDSLKSDLNDLITAYNSHIHITTATVGATAVPGVISPTTSTGTPSTADMSGAKVDTVELPS